MSSVRHAARPLSAPLHAALGWQTLVNVMQASGLFVASHPHADCTSIRQRSTPLRVSNRTHSKFVDQLHKVACLAARAGAASRRCRWWILALLVVVITAAGVKSRLPRAGAEVANASAPALVQRLECGEARSLAIGDARCRAGAHGAAAELLRQASTIQRDMEQRSRTAMFAASIAAPPASHVQCVVLQVLHHIGLARPAAADGRISLVIPRSWVVTIRLQQSRPFAVVERRVAAGAASVECRGLNGIAALDLDRCAFVALFHGRAVVAERGRT